MKTLCLSVLLMAVLVLRSVSHPSHRRHEKSRENLKKRLQEAGLSNLTIHHEKVMMGLLYSTLHKHYLHLQIKINLVLKINYIDNFTKRTLLYSRYIYLL